jgi:hypothetical protein
VRQTRFYCQRDDGPEPPQADTPYQVVRAPLNQTAHAPTLSECAPPCIRCSGPSAPHHTRVPGHWMPATGVDESTGHPRGWASARGPSVESNILRSAPRLPTRAAAHNVDATLQQGQRAVCPSFRESPSSVRGTLVFARRARRRHTGSNALVIAVPSRSAHPETPPRAPPPPRSSPQHYRDLRGCRGDTSPIARREMTPRTYQEGSFSRQYSRVDSGWSFQNPRNRSSNI